jgi:quercetin dioxygenase-like cupin family protein
VIDSFPRPDWTPLPYDGCVNVEGRVVLHEDELALALLRFAPHGTIHEHPGESDAVVACLDGEGFTSVGPDVFPLAAGQRVRWPPGIPHRLWTEDSTMTTLMIERPPVSGTS